MGRAIILVCLLTMSACGTREEPPAAVSAPTPTVTQASLVSAALAPMPITVEVTGQIVAVTHATLSSKVQGTIEAIPVTTGSRVARGDTLVVLDRRDVAAAESRAAAEVEHRRARLTRLEELYRRESASKQDLDDATRAYRVAQAELRAASAQLTYAAIKAPFAGVIIEKLAEAGELATPGRPLLRLEDTDRLQLEATVAEADLKAVAPGHRVPVAIDALHGRPLVGTVAQVIPAGDPRTHSFLVKVDLPHMPDLRSGMFGRLQITKGTRETIVVPSSAVAERGALTGVFVVGADNTARLRWVKIGRRFDEHTEVLAGLNSGEQVLLQASKGVDGALVHAEDR